MLPIYYDPLSGATWRRLLRHPIRLGLRGGPRLAWRLLAGLWACRRFSCRFGAHWWRLLPTPFSDPEAKGECRLCGTTCTLTIKASHSAPASA